MKKNTAASGGIPIDGEGRVVDRGTEALIANMFRPAEAEMVPLNPQNYESFRGVPSRYAYGSGISLNLQERTTPYGDVRFVERPQEPTLQPLTPPSARIMARDPLPGADALPWAQQPMNAPLAQATESYAMGSPMPPPPLGTSFSVGSTGRDTPPPGKAKA